MAWLFNARCEAVIHEGESIGRDGMSREQETDAWSLRADTRVPYGELMATLDALRGAGYLKVALVGLEQGAR